MNGCSTLISKIVERLSSAVFEVESMMTCWAYHRQRNGDPQFRNRWDKCSTIWTPVNYPPFRLGRATSHS
jgi:hypothetical protein